MQYLSHQYWQRWHREYLQSLQNRDKWLHSKRNLTIGDVVLSKEDGRPCNQWPLAKVIKAYPSEDGRVRKVRILKADGSLDMQGKCQKPSTFLDRPIHKLVLLVPVEHQGSNGKERTETEEFPIEEPTAYITVRCPQEA